MTKREEIQQEALSLSLRFPRVGLGISMGLGKTLIGLRYIDDIQRTNNYQLKVLVVAPKLSIFQTWRDDAEKFGFPTELMESVTFTTYLSLHKQDPDVYHCLILDECHSLLYVHQTFLKLYKGRILGLTGTPPRYEWNEKGQMIKQYCPIIYRYITDEAVEDKILNDYRIIVHKMPLDRNPNLKVETKSGGFFTSEQKNYNYWSERVMNATTKKEEQITSIMRMKALMGFKTKENYARNLLHEIKEKVIVFCNTQEQADNMCAHSVHSNNPDGDDNLELFKQGVINQLSCVLQLNEGVNIPNLKSGIILHAYGNERKSSQRIGRLLRLNPNDRSTIHILCYTDTIDERWVREALKDFDPTKIRYHDTALMGKYTIEHQDEQALFS